MILLLVICPPYASPAPAGGGGVRDGDGIAGSGNVIQFPEPGARPILLRHVPPGDWWRTRGAINPLTVAGSCVGIPLPGLSADFGFQNFSAVPD